MLKIVEGSFYKRRDGEIIGPLRYIDKGVSHVFEADSFTSDGVKFPISYYADGSYWGDCEDELDLVERVPNPNATLPELDQIITDKIKEQDAEIERLEKHATQLSHDNVTLRAHIDELEALQLKAVTQLISADTEIHRLNIERDELRLQADALRTQNEAAQDAHQATRDSNKLLNGIRLYLEAKLAEYEKPKVVKQTWQNVFEDLTGGNVYCCREEANKYGAAEKRIAVLRRDRLSDGTVTCVLEPLGDGK